MTPTLTPRALPHRARTIRTVRAGARDAQGERPTQTVEGPWFRARRATRRQVEAQAGEGGYRRGEIRYVLIYGDRALDGTRVDVRASDTVEVDVRGTVERWQIAGPPLSFDSGLKEFGGQVELVRVEDSA